ncbi:oxidoreductase-like protein [Echria macrotheca]|uniref:Oxidoreductase-like protein n=1 Tax=Echria macrotheca TaxID=438768 RepID=A0AAJ0BIU6_9PEZI|nr:oxidoreductase-like protein [Echria macrotheca]
MAACVVLTIFFVVWLAYKDNARDRDIHRRRLAAEARIRECGPLPGPQYVVRTLDGELGKDVHTCAVPIFDYELLLTRDPVNVQAILATQSADWDVGKHRNASWRPFIGDGVFTLRGEPWKEARALVRPQFAREHICNLDMLERHVQHLFAAIDRKHHASVGGGQGGWTGEFDLQPLLFNMALDIITELIYGHSAHSQDPLARANLPELPGCGTPDRQNIGMHMDKGKAWIETRGALWKYRWLLPSWSFWKHCAAVHRYAEYFVRLRLTLGESYLSHMGNGAANKGYTVLHDPVDSTEAKDTEGRFVLLHELAKRTQNPVELRDQTLNVLTAGRDTTASLMGWVFYFLARNATVLSKLRTQILAAFPSGPDGKEVDMTAIPAKDLLDKLPYLTSIINETLRVTPVIPLNERVAVRNTVLPRGGGPDGSMPVFVPEGRQVLIATYAMARREDIWGWDADEFRPERWEEDGGRKFGFEFIPFGQGVRQCLGQQFARIQTAYVVVRMLQRYEHIECADDPNAPLRFHHTIENRSGSGVQGHTLLIQAPADPPPGYLDSLRERFPDLEVLVHKKSWFSADNTVADDEYARTTIMMAPFAPVPTPDQVPRLELVQLQSAGANHLLEHPLFVDTEVKFCTANGVHGPQISEWIIGTYLAAQHQLPLYLDLQKQGKWNRGDETYRIEDAVSKTIGILGYGAIGRQTARLATAMGMKIHAYTLHPRPTPTSRRDQGWSPPGLGDPEGTFPTKWFSGPSTTDLHAFLSSGLDLLVIATPLTDSTRHLLGPEEFKILHESMKGRTFVSNIARGPVVDTDALIEALEGGLIRGAALDVTDPEPLGDGHPLWGARNVIITPHVSGASTAYVERALAILRENLVRFSEGGRLVNLVDKKRGY